MPGIIDDQSRQTVPSPESAASPTARLGGAAPSADSSMRWPDFFIVGAPKTGTTSLYRYLDQHPGVCFPRHKELHYFGSDLDWRERFVSREECLAQYAEAPREALLGEGSVLYLVSTRAAAEIHAVRPDARIIAMVRDPVTMIPSLHRQALRTGDEIHLDLSAALDAEGARAAVPRHPDDPSSVRELVQYGRIARYAEQIARFIDLFGRDNVLVLEFEAFSRDTAGSYARVLDFLGLDPHAPRIERHNEAVTIRAPRFWRALKHPPARARRFWRATLPRGLRSLILHRANRLAFRPGPGARPSLAEQTRIFELYRAEIEPLEALAGLDLSHWKIPPEARGADRPGN